MPTHNDKEEFLQKVLSYIKLPFDREDIYNELNNHMEDHINDYMEEGYTNEEAIENVIEVMGDATDLGKELNQMHKPLLGWVWKISDILVKIIGVVVILCLGIILLSSIDLNSPSSYINEEDIVYHLKNDEQAKIDNWIIKVTDIIYEQDGTLHIFYKTYSDSIFVNTWSFGNIGTITDEFGNEYHGGSGSSSGLISHNNIQINDFPETSDSLNIVYDRYNRHYEFHFDLKAGVENE